MKETEWRLETFPFFKERKSFPSTSSIFFWLFCKTEERVSVGEILCCLGVYSGKYSKSKNKWSWRIKKKNNKGKSLKFVCLLSILNFLSCQFWRFIDENSTVFEASIVLGSRLTKLIQHEYSSKKFFLKIVAISIISCYFDRRQFVLYSIASSWKLSWSFSSLNDFLKNTQINFFEHFHEKSL